MRTELILAPIIIEQFIPSFVHDQVVEYVENELSSNATTLIYIDLRGAGGAFGQVMTFKRPIGTLPARHLFCLKWIRMMEFSGLLPKLTGEDDHETFLAQMYVGILHGDGKASVTFETTRRWGSWGEENQGMLQQRCLDYFTPNFEDVFSETTEMFRNLSNALPDSAMAEFGRRHLSGGSPGWATSR